MAKPPGLKEPTVMERGARIAVYGQYGTGKTEFLMSARHIGKLLVLDTEGTTQFYDPSVGYGFEAMYSEKASDAIALLKYAEELHAQGQRAIMGIDSYSSIWYARQQVATAAGSNRAGKAKFSSWGVAKEPLKALYAAIFETPVDVIITMRAKPKYEQEQSGKIIDFGYDAPDTERGLPYTVDLVLEMRKTEKAPGEVLKPEDFYAVVVKTSGERGGKLPIGTKIVDPTVGKVVGLRLSGATGGIRLERDDGILKQAGIGAAKSADFKDWVSSLGLDTDEVLDALRKEFDKELVKGKIPEYAEWVWTNRYKA